MEKLEITQGTKFGRLTIVSESEETVLPSGQKHRKFLCQCECGQETTVRLSHLRSDITQSCGCLQLEIATRHGLRNDPIYSRCIKAIARCHNPKDPKFPRYGGRSIEVFHEWRKDIGKFVRFLKELPGANNSSLSIDRIDNDRGYEPGNLRFTCNSVQIRNQSARGEIPFVGVSRNGHKYKAQIWIEGATKYLGTFDTPEKASEAYQKAKVLNEIDRGRSV